MTATLGILEHNCSNPRFCDGEVIALTGSTSTIRKTTLVMEGRIIKTFNSKDDAIEWATSHSITVIDV